MNSTIISSEPKIAVLGAGGWGTSLAILLASNKYKVHLWEYFGNYADILRKKRENPIFLKGVKIPYCINITSDIEEALANTNLVVLTIPSKFLRKTLKGIRRYITKKSFVISGIKGIEKTTLKRPSEIIKEILGVKNVVCLSGPSHAEEVAKLIPTAVVAAGSFELTYLAQRIFSNKYFRVYPSSDIIGVELAGALKNVIAIAAGIVDKFYNSDNPKAALITRGLAEITRLGVKMKARTMTFLGLAGIGDLVVTCGSIHSRNRKVGRMLASGKSIIEINKKMKMVAEGVTTTKSSYQLSKKYNVAMPITSEIYKILYLNKSPKLAIEDILKRKPAKGEFDFI